MVKPSSGSGQRRKAISWRTMRGRLGSNRVVSMASAPTPVAAAARPMNFRLVMGKNGKRICGVTARIQDNRRCRILDSRDRLDEPAGTSLGTETDDRILGTAENPHFSRRERARNGASDGIFFRN